MMSRKLNKFNFCKGRFQRRFMWMRDQQE